MIAVAIAAVVAAQAPQEDPARTAAAALAMYQQSCQVRAYGSYDDLCSQLRRQLRDAEKAARKARSAKPAPVADAPSPRPEPAPIAQASAPERN